MEFRFLVNIIFTILVIALAFFVIGLFLSFRLCPLCPVTIATAITLQNSLPGESISHIYGIHNTLIIKDHYITDIIKVWNSMETFKNILIAIAVAALVVAVIAATGGTAAPIVAFAIFKGALLGFVTLALTSITNKPIFYLYNGDVINKVRCRYDTIPIGLFFYFGKLRVKQCLYENFYICSNLKNVHFIDCIPFYVLYSKWDYTLIKKEKGVQLIFKEWS